MARISVRWLGGLASMIAMHTALASYTITGLGPLPGDTVSGVSAINNHGQIVGTSGRSDLNNNFVDSRGYLNSNGVLLDLQTLPGGAFSAADGINDSGQVVGTSDSPVGQRAFLYANGAMQSLGILAGDTDSYASAINNRGQVVGSSGVSGESAQAFLYEDGIMRGLGYLAGSAVSVALDINNSGQVVGFGQGPEGERAFLFADGVMQDLGTLPGGSFSIAWGIGDGGHVVGYGANSLGRSRAFLYENGVMSDLGTFAGGRNSFAYGVNNAGVVVGGSESAQGYRAFMYSGNTMFDLNQMLAPDTGWTLLNALSINDAGQIIGIGTFGLETRRAFLLTPDALSAVPEPATTWLLLAGLGALAGLSRRPSASVRRHRHSS